MSPLSPFSQRELDEVREIRSALARVVEGAPPVLPEVLPRISRLIGAERSLAYGVSCTEGELSVPFAHATALEASTRSVLERMYRETPLTAAAFNPARPEHRQRNRALNFEELSRVSETVRTSRLRQEGFAQVGLQDMDQLRVLVCEGESLLAWVGGFRTDRFTAHELKLLDQLTPALRHRLWLERQLDRSRFALAALDEVLAQLPTAAFVVRTNGAIAHANEAGRILLQKDRAGTRERVARSVQMPSSEAAFAISPLSARGAPDHLLAMERARAPRDRAQIGAEAARRWQLTRRQTEVLGLVLKGYANKSIAAELQCSVKTVEVHLTAMLRKAGAKSRADLIAQLLPPA